MIDNLNDPDDIILDQGMLYFATLGDGTVWRVPAVGGTATPLATGQLTPRRLAVDAGYLYWTEQQNAAIRRVALAGGSPQVVVAANEPWDVALDATHLYWSSIGDKSIWRVAKAAGGPQQIWSGTFIDFPLEIADDANYLYWILGRGFMHVNRGFMRASKSSGAVELVHATQAPVPGDVVSNGSQVCWSNAFLECAPAHDLTHVVHPYGVRRAQALVFHSDRVAALAEYQTYIYDAAACPSAPAVLARPSEGRRLATDGNYLYFTEVNPSTAVGAIRRMQLL